MKILLTTDCYAPTVNGVVTSVLTLKQALTEQGHEVRVLTLSNSAHSYQEGDVTYIGAASAGMIYPGVRLRTAPALALLRRLARWRPDVIHSQCEFSTFFMARRLAAATGAPLVHTYHTVYEDYTHYFSPSRRWGRAAVAAFTRWVVGQTACVIAPTQKVRRLLEGYQVTAPIAVIPTGIDLTRFSEPADNEARRALRLRLGLPEDAVVLTYIGRLAEEKNIGRLLQYVAGVKDENIRLMVVGDGPYRATLEAMVRDLGISRRVCFTGMVPREQVADYYRAGDLFVSASSSETQGLTYLEALSCGLPALCLRDECLAGVILDGVNGWQFRDGAQFQLCLHRFLSDPQLRRELGKNAAELARREFSAEAFGRRAEALYEQVIREGKKTSGAA